jgi:hypothetical protein
VEFFDVKVWFQLVFSASSSGPTSGDVSLDDISIRLEPCEGKISCDFERGDLCSWRNSEHANSEFLVSRGEFSIWEGNLLKIGKSTLVISQ